MKIFLTIIIVSFILSAFAQGKSNLGKDLLAIEFSIWNSQDKKEVSEMIVLKAEKLTQQGSFYDANNELNRIKDCTYIDTNKLLYKKSLNHFMLGNYEDTYNLLQEIPDSLRLLNKEYITLWLFTLNELKQWDKCKQILKTIIDTTAFQKEELEKLPIGIKYKSPLKAMHLSGLFPGLGQYYAGYPTKGTTSILLHATFGFVLVESIISGLYVTSVIYGLNPILRFYVGGKQNGYHLTEDYNNKQISQLKNKYLRNINLLTNRFDTK